MDTFEIIVYGWTSGKYYVDPIDTLFLDSRINEGADTFTFSYLRDKATNKSLNIELGYKVILQQNTGLHIQKVLFSGTIFSLQKMEDGVTKCIAYDKLRYLKSRDSFAYHYITATRVIKLLCMKWGITTGSIVDTLVPISKMEISQSIYDMMLNALDSTTMKNGIHYILYMTGDKLNVAPLNSLVSSYYLTSEDCEGYTYTQDIMEKSYNRIKLTSTNLSDYGKIEMFETLDNKINIQAWGGVLQYYGVVNRREIPSLLPLYMKQYGRDMKILSINNAIGDISLRAGYSIYVNLDVNGTEFCRPLRILSMTHKISNSEHVMDLSLEARGSGLIEIWK